ncbi:CBS domain-containing protein [Roseisolibacter sp. H3M3-2]|uniref:CBS domain-containing protein n=1 Tax=Roseisolibacter sp. H3M3-2 TaxID=3031323 RepID=UPI0023D9AB94|nr:CBS domain-containing protein [Roseisolibacter sp. H3M3-2]MDF1502172.1 CNNM domain-containing protein [Roseisolibacter sp. H3M3-2]
MSFATLTVLAVLVVAALTAGSIAVRSVSRIWLRHWVERRLAGASLAELYLDRPQRLIVSAGAGIALTVFLAGAGVAAIDASPLTLAWHALLLAVAVLAAGQVLPRALARRWPARTVPALVPALHAVDALLLPLGAPDGAAARALRVARPAAPVEDARDDIEDLLREGQLEGLGAPGELAIITGVVQFGEKTARDVMTPREQVFALDAALPPRELAARLAQSAYSRVPVYRGQLDDVTGIIHAFDVLDTAGEVPPPVLPVHVAAPGTACNDLLFAMLRSRRLLAVVREPGGALLGIVTLEDVLEELVGDIRDEHDEPAPPESANDRT